MELSGKVALVTGASRGIGRAVAERLASEGAHVALNFASREDAAREVLAGIERSGGAGTLARFDVGDAAGVDAAVKRILDARGRIDILVNNAGIARDNLLMRLTEADFDEVVRINLKGAFLVTKAVARPMVRQKGGRILVVSSVVGEMGNAGQSIYSASKAGLIGFTKSLARELASRGITVNAVTPGFIATDMTDALPEGSRDAFREQIPLGRFGAPSEVAALAAFLVSDEAGYITGQIIGINGGLYM